MSIERLLTIMSRLRDPQSGCPWDKEQTFATIAPYTIEEAYEVADAIERGNLDDLKGELGDLLFQVVFHAHMAREQGKFDFDDVVNAISVKLERRHPHVFMTARDGGNAGPTHVPYSAAIPNIHVGQNAGAVFSSDAVIESAQSKTPRGKTTNAGKSGAHAKASALDDVPVGLPALTRAAKLGKRASSVGFDWPDIHGVLDKKEEVRELRAEIKQNQHDKIQTNSAMCCSASSTSVVIFKWI